MKKEARFSLDLHSRGVDPFSSLFAAAMLALASMPASAVLLSWDDWGDDPVNDCKGYFGENFDACQIFGPDADGNNIQISPVIAKFETDDNNEFYDDYTPPAGEELEINLADFPTVDGDEWTFVAAGNGSKIGSWTYNPQPPTQDSEGDPDILYWVTKAGDGFTLYWDVDQTALDMDGACADPANLFSLACLEEANAVTSGSWEIDQGLSHIAFYDSANPQLIPPPIPGIPAPAPLALIGLGGILLGWVTRRARTA